METRSITFNNLTEEQINAIKVLIGDDCNIEEQKEKEEAEFPKYGSEYYYIDYEVCKSAWCDDAIDKNRLSVGNIFKTREEAEFEVERLKVIHEMKQFAEPKDYEWDSFNEHYYIYYRFMNYMNTNDVVEIGHVNSCKSDEIYFKSEKDAKACIEAVGEDRIKKYYLRIED